MGRASDIEINEQVTRRMAELARLELTDAEVSAFTPQLGEILKYVTQLSEADVTGVEPLLHAVEASELEPPMREDAARPFARDAEGRPKVLGSGPEVVDDGFKVPQIL